VPKNKSTQDPLEFLRGVWGNMGFPLPGMMTPTLDIHELDKRITDLKAVEHWLKVNLNMLQMTTQGLEMQRATLATVQAMSAQATTAGSKSSDTGSENTESSPNPFANAAAAMWPWNLINTPSADNTASDENDVENARQTADKPSRRRSGDDQKAQPSTTASRTKKPKS